MSLSSVLVELAPRYTARQIRGLWALPLLTVPLVAQTPVFEVASVRPSNSSINSAGFCHALKPGTEHVQVQGISLNLLVIDAYETYAERFDLPDWGRSRFDVNVKMPPNTDMAACRQMLQSLLTERFHMVTAVQTVEMPTYFLKVAKSGLKLKPVDHPPADPNASSIRKMEDGISHWTFRGAPMSRVLLPLLAEIVIGSRSGVYGTDRLIDETALTGYYDGELRFLATLQATSDGQLQGATLSDALIDQAGLILELRKAPATVLTIRSADRMPTEN